MSELPLPDSTIFTIPTTTSSNIDGLPALAEAASIQSHMRPRQPKASQSAPKAEPQKLSESMTTPRFHVRSVSNDDRAKIVTLHKTIRFGSQNDSEIYTFVGAKQGVEYADWSIEDLEQWEAMKARQWI